MIHYIDVTILANLCYECVTGEDAMLGDQTYHYLTADEMKSLGDDSMPIDVTNEDKIEPIIQSAQFTNVYAGKKIYIFLILLSTTPSKDQAGCDTHFSTKEP